MLHIRTPALIICCLAAVLACAPSLASAAPTYPADFQEQPIVTGLTQPIAAEWAPDGRLFIAEKPGVLKVVPPGATTATTILDISGQVTRATTAACSTSRSTRISTRTASSICSTSSSGTR